MPTEDEGDDERHVLLRRQELESILRGRRAHIAVCAWCESVCIQGDWYPESDLMTVAWRLDPRASHTICPLCFEQLVPDVPYPHDD